MGLKHLQHQVATISTPGGDITVRGLNLDDITTLVGAHRQVLSAFFESVTVRAGDLSLDDTASLATALFTAAPAAAAHIIALGCDEPDVDLARKLAFPVQMAALEEIGRLTFAAEGGPKKVLETVLRVAKGANGAIKALSPSAIGSGVSDDR